MKKHLLILLAAVLMILCINSQLLLAQAPQALSYQAVVFNSENALVRNSAIGMRISILQENATGVIVYQEVYNPNPQTNDNGVVSIEIGTGTAVTGVFSEIDWATGPYFIKSESDLTGGTNYTISGISQVLSTPYALYANTAGNGFSGDYNDLTNQPLNDGSETKIIAGSNVTIDGSGTTTNPYIINSTATANVGSNKITITNNMIYTIPAGVSKIKVELWGAAGGGGGAGSSGYSYYLNDGGAGGGGGFAMQEYDVETGQQFEITIGSGGNAGVNAVYNGGNYYGDSNGGNGGDSYFGNIKAAGGTGGKKGSYSYNTTNGNPGTANIGAVTAHASTGASNKLEVFYGYERSYLAERLYTSIPGKGGSLSSYSGSTPPTDGEGGSAVITILE